MLVKLTDVINDAASQNYAVPAFNVFGYEDAYAVISAAEIINAPVIIATNKVAIQHMPINILAKVLIGAAEQSSVPVVVHLDHGNDYDTVAKALQNGYSSVMYDGSQLSFNDNVNTTKEIAKLSHAFGIPIEAEIGSVGYNDPSLGILGAYTDPEEAKSFAEETSVDALAVSVGTLHRMEEQTASVQFDRLEQIQQVVNIPLVMHGSTGIPNNDLKKLTSTRVAKVNIGTALRMAFGNALREEMSAKPHEFDRISLFKSPMKYVEKVALQKMKLLNMENYEKNRVL